MSWVVTAVVGTSLVTTGISAYSANQARGDQMQASREAGDVSLQATRESNEAMLTAQREANDLTEKMFYETREDQKPYMSAGNAALEKLLGKPIWSDDPRLKDADFRLQYGLPESAYEPTDSGELIEKRKADNRELLPGVTEENGKFFNKNGDELREEDAYKGDWSSFFESRRDRKATEEAGGMFEGGTDEQRAEALKAAGVELQPDIVEMNGEFYRKGPAEGGGMGISVPSFDKVTREEAYGLPEGSTAEGGGMSGLASSAMSGGKSALSKAANKQAVEQAGRDREIIGYEEGGLMEGPGEFEKSPGYEFRLQEGVRALDQSAASRGRRKSGAHMRDIVEFGQNYATQDYDNFLNRYYQSLNPWLTMAGKGQVAANQTGSMGMNAAATMGGNTMSTGVNRASNYQTGAAQQGNALMNAGNASAQGSANVSNIMSQGTSDISHILGYYMGGGSGGGLFGGQGSSFG